MRSIRRWLLITVLMIVVLLSAGFSLWNTTPVALSFGFVTLAERPLALWIILSFAIGGVLGLLLGSGVMRDMVLRRRIRALEKELQTRPKFQPADRDL